ncbi:MAG: prepilin-type N-terminal cleavage/methylation domain-containing protein [Elainellaceae cyanobacterium]
MGYLRHFAQNHTASTDQGLTLAECLIAIAVVGITGLLITPPLFISAATRVQNRRSEQALKVAQGEVDRVRLLVERGRQSAGFDVDNNPVAPTEGQALPPEVVDINAAPAPTALSGQLESVNGSFDTFGGAALPNAQTALPVDTDGDGEADYFMQTFRDEGFRTNGANQLESFRMGVRVYAIAAEDNLGALGVEEASLRYTTGLGNQQQQPLAVLYSDFVRSDRDNSVCQYQDLAGICPTPVSTTP